MSLVFWCWCDQRMKWLLATLLISCVILRKFMIHCLKTAFLSQFICINRNAVQPHASLEVFHRLMTMWELDTRHKLANTDWHGNVLKFQLYRKKKTYFLDTCSTWKFTGGKKKLHLLLQKMVKHGGRSQHNVPYLAQTAAINSPPSPSYEECKCLFFNTSMENGKPTENRFHLLANTFKVLSPCGCRHSC